MAQSNHGHLNTDLEYILQLVYDLRLCELQEILEFNKQNKSGSKQSLRKRVLSFLSGSSAKTRALRHKIAQVYNSRSNINHNSQQRQQPQPQRQQPQPQRQQPQPQRQQPQRHSNLRQPHFRLPQLRQPPQQSSTFIQRLIQQQNPSYNSYSTNRVQNYNEIPTNPIATTQFEHLPFFKMMQTLLEPMHCQPIVDAANFTGLFFLTEGVRHSIAKSWNIIKQEYKIQIILRLMQIGLKENVTERLPYNLSVSVNDRQCKLPTLNIPTKAGITPWRCNVPIDITQQTDLRNSSQNTLKITWSTDPHEYIAGVFVAQKVTWSELLVELKKRPVRPFEKTKELIKKSMESDADMGVDSMFATVKDPLSKTRMELPARGVDCIHLQCFDAIQFLQMNEQKQTWTCPLCKKKINFEHIEVDDFFLKILQSPNLSEECENVILLKDGSWTEKKTEDHSNRYKVNDHQSNNNIEVFTLSDSDDEDIPPVTKKTKYSPDIEEPIVKAENTAEIEDLTKSDNTNSVENDLVLDLSVKNNSSPSTSSESHSCITLNDDISSFVGSSNHFLNNFNLPNITITEGSSKNNPKPNASGSSKNNKHQEKDQSLPVLCVITLD